jgi:hypothetical protein
MERPWKVLRGVLAVFGVAVVMAVASGAAMAQDDGREVSLGSTGIGMTPTPGYLEGNSQGDGSGR